MKILFVCTGNTCRSPMAEALGKKLFPQYDFSSAGIFAVTGSGVSENAVLAMKDYGIDISNHKATQLTLDLIKEFDFIIPMTMSHKQMLLGLGVNSDKIVMFDEEISDPYSGDLEIYKDCAKQLKDNIKLTIGKLS